jgi:mono/diheme cytochrome c family protein
MLITYPLVDMRALARFLPTAILLFPGSVVAIAQQVDFARDVEPILRANCQGCHGQSQQMSGLRLDQPAAAMTGSYSGPVIKPRDSAGSLLITMVSGRGKVKMPPAGPGLKSEQVATLRRWIDEGAVWPATASPQRTIQARSTHWSYQPVQRSQVPAVKAAQSVRNPIDAFIVARLEREGIAPSPETDRRTLIRRVSLDLIGLPPSLGEVEDFVADQRPDAYERLVDRLLQSPHYGEKWARHWLDLARYADSDGYEKDLPRPSAWRWRKWVIDSLNKDLPFDEFTLEQIAGDLLPNATAEQRVATGFHRNSLVNREGGIDREQLRIEQAVDRTNTVGSVWLGLTVGCAQCHDHKYDKISQKEYYQLFAFFSPAEDSEIEAPIPGEVGPYLRTLKQYQEKRAELIKEYGVEPLQKEWEPKVIEASRNPGKYGGDWDLAWTVLWNDERKILLKNPAERTRKQADKLTDHFLEWYSAVISKERYAQLKFKELREKLAQLRETYPALTEASGIVDMPSPPAPHVLIRGDFRNPGIEVQPNVLAVLNPLNAGD